VSTADARENFAKDPLVTHQARVLAASLGAVALLLGATLAAFAMPRADRVIKVVAATSSFELQEKPPPGPSGDTVVGSSRLRNAVAQFGKPKGALVGLDRYRYVFVSLHTAAIDVTATLPGGTIRCRGQIDDRLTVQLLQVVSGTLAYARTKGTCEARPLTKNETDPRTLNTYRLKASR